MQERKGLETPLNAGKGDFLGRARKYYRDDLNLELSSSNQSWERLKILAMLRNAIVHANGHLDRVNPQNRKKIFKWIEQDIGIEDYDGELTVNGSFVRKTFQIVKGDLEDLINRFKKNHSPGWTVSK